MDTQSEVEEILQLCGEELAFATDEFVLTLSDVQNEIRYGGSA